MFERFKKGVIPAESGESVYTNLEDHPGDGHDPALDGDQMQLHDLFPVDRALIKAHLEEK